MMVVKITVGCRPSDGRVVPVVRGYLACIKKGWLDTHEILGEDPKLFH